jgi:cell division protein FtsI (penicillin-binding protein 3)
LKQKISGGEWMPIKTAGQIEPQDGYDIITTIDLGLQDIAESTLNQALKEYQAEFGCAILMEVKTGAIKAIANLGNTKDSSYYENYNYALGLRNEPGSVFKVAAYLALFDDGYLTLNDSINTDHASAVFAGQVLTDDGHNTQYTFVKPELALAISSNVAIAKWVTKYYSSNKNKFYQKLVQFGLTDKTNVELEGEPSPFIQTPDKWSALSLPWMAHGYEVKFTPLQLLTFYNAIANKGNRIKPYLVQKIVLNGKVIKEFTPETTQNKICSDKAAEYAKQIMLAVVESEHGTGRKIFTPHYRIAGKTGTAKMSFGSTGYSNKNLSSFVGFFPADNPIYTCIVVVGGPQGFLTTGGAVSAPVFRVIADKIITSNIQRDKAFNKDSSIVNQYPPMIVGETQQVKNIAELFRFKPNIKDSWDYTAAKIVPRKTIVEQVDINANTIPNVKGMLLDDAIYLLENAGMKVQFSGKGKVQMQSVPAGSPAMKGMIIYLQLG